MDLGHPAPAQPLKGSQGSSSLWEGLFRRKQKIELRGLGRLSSDEKTLGFAVIALARRLVALGFLGSIRNSLLEQKLYLLIKRAVFMFRKIGKAILKCLLNPK
jgi:hypothetical protein